MKETKLIILLIIICTFVITGCNDKKNNNEKKITVSSTTTAKITSTEPTTNSMTTTNHQEEQKPVTTTSKKPNTTKSTTKKTTKSTTKKTTTRKPTTTRVTTVEQKCTPMTKLPEGAVWYVEWGPDKPLDFGNWDAYYASVNPMKKLLNIAGDINASLGYGRTEGGLYHISCMNDTFSFYGAYFEVYGFTSGNTQVSKGYMRPDGSIKWLYKNY